MMRHKSDVAIVMPDAAITNTIKDAFLLPLPRYATLMPLLRQPDAATMLF